MCTVCGKVLSSAGVLRRHEDIHSEKKFECYICHKEISSIWAVRKHIKCAHTKRKMVKCEICSEEVKEFRLKDHIKYRHVEGSDTRIKCDYCDRWLLKQSMKAHIKHSHQKQGANCPICGKHLKHKDSISSHLRQVHNKGVKKWKCNYCDKGYYTQTKLKEHVAVVHTREYPWACRVCGRQYRAEANWRMHEKKSHPEESAKLFNKPNYLKSNEEILTEQSQQEEMFEYSVMEEGEIA